NLEDKGKLLAPFTIARVISAEQHPNADRLRVCMVDTGAGEPVQVVCGAPNARAGMKGVFVPPGAFIPGKNITLAVGKIRGVESGPSPDWLQRRLAAIGLRPINALVDITNFITYDRGRPLHVFDAAKVRSNLTVRRARPGETLTALDGKTYALDETMCVIADEAGPESLAGIMGGEATGCSEATTDVLIESALWEPINIAQTGRKLGINSDARYRFERGVDPAFMVPGLELATQLVLQLCGGEPSDITVAGEVPLQPRVIDFPVTEVKRLCGIDPAVAAVVAILESLGFACKADRAHGRVQATVPTWRPDVTL